MFGSLNVSSEIKPLVHMNLEYSQVTMEIIDERISQLHNKNIS